MVYTGAGRVSSVSEDPADWRGSSDCDVEMCSFFGLCGGSGHEYERSEHSIQHDKLTGRSPVAWRWRSAEGAPAAAPLPADTITKEITP